MLLEEFFNYQYHQFWDWFDRGDTRDNVKGYLIQDFERFKKENYKLWYYLLFKKRVEKKLFVNFLNSDYPRIKYWFKKETGLWNRLKAIIIKDYDEFIQ